MKYSFYNDYSEGAHPNILDTLSKTNSVQQTGYGEDEYCKEAALLIKKSINDMKAEVHFVSGGTQANLIVISALLKPYESVIATSEGHIHTHEAGAVEATGHKIITVVNADGKLTSDDIAGIVESHKDEHMVKPKVVFISDSTEVGTIYSKRELESLSEVCHKNDLYLYLDGARLGSALTAKGNDLTLADIAKLVDIFYIGGTKNGALLGEAIVIINNDLKIEFRRSLKQRGALLAKGRILGIQFLELFKDGLYFDLARHANMMAEKLSEGIKDLNYKFLSPSPTNQVFPIFPNEVIDKLKNIYGFYVWSKVDAKSSSIRLVTSWATDEKAVSDFLQDLENLSGKNG